MVLESCYSRSNENPDRFSQCVVDNNKKINDIMESFQFKMLFLSRHAKGCLERGNVKECTEKVTTQGKGVIESLLKSLNSV